MKVIAKFMHVFPLKTGGFKYIRPGEEITPDNTSKDYFERISNSTHYAQQKIEDAEDANAEVVVEKNPKKKKPAKKTSKKAAKKA